MKIIQPRWNGEWFRKAAHKGNAYAQRNLGRLTKKLSKKANAEV